MLFIATSCSYRVYTVNALRANYTLGMQTPEEMDAKENVHIYLSEQEVPGNYNIIAFVESRPVLPVAIQSQQLKNFYKQAVLKAKELGGDGIIVTAVGQFKVIKFTGTSLRQGPTRRPPVVREEPQPRQETIQKEDKPEQAAPAANAPRRSARDLFKTPARSSETSTEKAPATKSSTSTTTSKTAKSATTATKAPKTSTKSGKTTRMATAAAATTAAATAASAAATKSASATSKTAKTEPAAKPAATTKPAATSKPATTTTTVTKAAETPAAKPAASAAERAAIFDESTLQWFTSGYVYRAKEQEQVEIIETMNNEIRDNIAICQTRSEAEFIMTKVDQLEKYNKALPIPSGTQSNKIKGYRNALDKIMGMEEEKPQKKSGAFDDAVQSVKGFFGKLKKK